VSGAPEPPDWRTDPERGFELRKRFLALVAKECANWSQKAYDQYSKLLSGRKFDVSEQEMADGLDAALKTYHTDDAHLFLCIADPCCDLAHFDFDEERLAELSRQFGVRITSTWCQFQCGEGPMGSLRIGDGCRMLAKFAEPSEWLEVLDYASRCSAATGFIDDEVYRRYAYERPDLEDG